MEEIMTQEEDITSIAQDLAFVLKCYKLLRKLGYIKSQYEFSEQFLNKNKYYLGMVLCEGRQPSIDALHNLIVNLNELHSQNAVTYIAQMHEQGQQILTQRLLKFL